LPTTRQSTHDSGRWIYTVGPSFQCRFWQHCSGTVKKKGQRKRGTCGNQYHLAPRSFLMRKARLRMKRSSSSTALLVARIRKNKQLLTREEGVHQRRSLKTIVADRQAKTIPSTILRQVIFPAPKDGRRPYVNPLLAASTISTFCIMGGRTDSKCRPASLLSAKQTYRKKAIREGSS